MYLSIPASLLPLLHLTSALPQALTQSISARTCETILPPTNYYQIYEDPEFINQTSGLGPFSPNGGFSFAVSQLANNVNERDLVVSFKNVPCPPAGPGPYRLEFLFLPDPRYTVSGTNTRVDVFTINGDLPAIYFSDGEISEYPQWDSTNRQTGPRIGSFTFPTGNKANKAKTLFRKKVECMPTINLRFSITNDSPEAGNINYFHDTDAGLRIRYGC